MSWTIHLNRVAASGIIGVHAWERSQQQTLYVSANLHADLDAAADQDDVTLTVDYSAVAQLIREVVVSAEARLIEHLAKQIASQLLTAFPLTEVEIRIDKPDAVTATERIGVSYRAASQSAM